MPALFHGQRANEEVVLLTKQHPFILLRPMLVSGLILLIPFAVNIFFQFGVVMAVAVVLSLIVAILHGLHAYHVWSSSVLLLTNERVIMLEQKGLMNREFAECGLYTIQQVSHEVKGLVPSLFGYGTIKIYTAGAREPFLLPNTPDPYEVQQEIQRAAAGESERGELEEEK